MCCIDSRVIYEEKFYEPYNKKGIAKSWLAYDPHPDELVE